MPRKRTKTKIKKDIEKIVKTFVRNRDNNTCQKCGKQVFGSNCHVSHVKSVGAYPNLQFDPLNMKVLCYRCHIFWWHKEPTEAGQWFEERFPDRFLYLEKAKNERISLSTYELEELLKQWRKRS